MSIITFRMEIDFYLLKKEKNNNNGSTAFRITNTLAGFYYLATNYIFYF